MLLKILPGTPSDYLAITEVNDLVFGQPNEGKLIENLRKNPKFIPELSLVTDVDGKIACHIFFFPIVIKIREWRRERNDIICSGCSFA